MSLQHLKVVNVFGNFPAFMPKTDLERVQNLAKELEENLGLSYDVQEKLDGSSVTIYYHHPTEEYGVCSRNYILNLEHDNIFTRTAKVHLENLIKYCQEQSSSLALQGELIGEGVQGNKYNLKGHQIRFFQLYDMDSACYVDDTELIDWANSNKFPLVPCLEADNTIHTDFDKWLALAEGKSELNPKQEREGIVIRVPSTKLAFKVISNKFLLKEKD